jgi:hypothetical protein
MTAPVLLRNETEQKKERKENKEMKMKKDKKESTRDFICPIFDFL